MPSRKKFITRSAFDRRTSLDRRTINLGAKYPNHDHRTGQNRRQCWEKRYDWEPKNRWRSSPIHFKNPKPYKSL